MKTEVQGSKLKVQSKENAKPETAEVENCPHCGGNAHLCVAAYVGTFRVVCDNCGAHGPERCLKEDALKTWNARAGKTKFETFIPSNEYGIAEGNYDINGIVEILREHKNNPVAVQYIADMLEE